MSFRENSTLRSSGIQSTAFSSQSKSVMYTMALQDLVLCLGMGEISSARQKPSEAGHLIDHLAWRFLLFSQWSPHQSGNQSQLFHALASSLQCDWRPTRPSLNPGQLFLHQLRGRKHCPRILPDFIASRQMSQGLLSSQTFRCSGQGHGAPGFSPHWSYIWRLRQAHAGVQPFLSRVLHHWAGACSLPWAGQQRRTDLQDQSKYIHIVSCILFVFIKADIFGYIIH